MSKGLKINAWKQLKCNVGENVRDWYKSKYPWDSLGEEIDENICFLDIVNGLNEGKDIYKVIGVGDSCIREIIFSSLADRLKVDYDVIYEKWIHRGSGYDIVVW